jgi:hypothetical protein
VPLEIVRGRSLRCSAEKWRRSNTSASIELEIRQILSGSLSVSSAKVRSYDAGASLAKAGEVSPGLTIILVGQVEIARRDELGHSMPIKAGPVVAVGSDGDDLRRAPPQAPPARHNPIL